MSLIVNDIFDTTNQLFVFVSIIIYLKGNNSQCKYSNIDKINIILKSLKH